MLNNTPNKESDEENSLKSNTEIKNFLNFTANRKRRQGLMNAPIAIDLSEQKSNVVKIDPNKSK